MSLSHKYRQLAVLIEALEGHGIEVRDAKPADEADVEETNDGFPVELSVRLPAVADLDSLHAEAVGNGETGTPETDETAPAGAGTDEAVGAGDARPETDGAETTEAADDITAPTETTDETSDDAAADDEAVACTHPGCDRTFDTARGMKIHRTKAHPLSELTDEANDRAVHHDPDVLASVYDEHETFAEMTDALGVDVGAQAVRKQMIRHGIHEPGETDPSDGTKTDDGGSSGALPDDDVDDRETRAEAGGAGSPVPADEAEPSNDAGDGDETAVGGDSTEADTASPNGEFSRTGAGPGDAPSASPDGSAQVADRLPALDLPGPLTTRELRVAVEEANTLYDVQRALDLDRETVRDILTEYDLLELVSGRAASVRDREELKAEIDQRIRRTAT